MTICPQCKGQLPDPTDCVETRPRCDCLASEDSDATRADLERHEAEQQAARAEQPKAT